MNLIQALGRQIVGEIDMAVIQVNEPEVAMHHIERAKKQLEELQREVYRLDKRSGEVK